MPRAKSPPRVKGPYSERGGTRFRIRICEPTGHRDLYFTTRQDALTGMRQAAQELAPGLGSLLLGDVLDEFTAERVLRGGATEKTANESRARLRRWFADALAEDIRKLTPRRATALYERLVHTPSCKTGKLPTAATHRFYLLMARALFRWALKRGYVRENPFQGVQPVGRPAAGKKQLRFEEAERFISAGFRLFDERGDAMALAAVTALLLGCRASEVTHLRARDLDCVGTRLWIAACDGDYRGKTRNATRNSDVPDVLRPRLLKRVEGLRPDDYLFGATAAVSPPAKTRRPALRTAGDRQGRRWRKARRA